MWRDHVLNQLGATRYSPKTKTPLRINGPSENRRSHREPSQKSRGKLNITNDTQTASSSVTEGLRVATQQAQTDTLEDRADISAVAASRKNGLLPERNLKRANARYQVLLNKHKALTIDFHNSPRTVESQRTQLESLQADIAVSTDLQSEIESLRAESMELKDLKAEMERIRAENTDLRISAVEIQALKAENHILKQGSMPL